MSGQCSPPLEGRSGNAQAPGTLAHRDSVHRLELRNGNWVRRPPKAFPLRPSTLEARDRALLQALAFELTQGRENCELEPAAGGAKIQTFFEGNEWNVQRLEILEHRQQMFQIASDSIESPAHNDLDPRAASIKKKPVKTWPAILRPAHLVGVFRMDGPAPRLAVATELEELVFARLRTIGGADAGVDSGLHGNTAFTFEVIRSPSQSMILTVILSSLRKARSAVEYKKRAARNRDPLCCVPAQDVLKCDQQVIGFWDSESSTG